jgi:hypothetical protein
VRADAGRSSTWMANRGVVGACRRPSPSGSPRCWHAPRHDRRCPSSPASWRPWWSHSSRPPTHGRWSRGSPSSWPSCSPRRSTTRQTSGSLAIGQHAHNGS